MPDPVILPADLPPCLLHYGFSTLPSPLQVSSATADSPGLINVWVSAPAGQTVYCSKIVIAVPIGSTGTDLSDHTPAVTPNTTWWAISSLTIETGDKLGLDPSTTYAIFTAVCASDAHRQIDYDLAFSLTTAAVNQTQGSFGYIAVETSGPDSGQLQQRRDVFDLTKGPVTTYLTNVVTTLAPPAATDLPVAQFTAGQPIRVAWESNAATFAVYVGSGAQPVWTGPDTSTVLSAGLTADSTIVVVASGGSDGAVRVDGLSVTIANPTLTPASVTAGSLAAGGATALAATTAANVSAAALHADGRAALNGPVQAGSLSASGATALQGQVAVTSATVSGALVSQGQAALGAAGSATLQVTGATAMFNPHAIGAGNYASASDGLVVGIVGYPSNAGQKCAAVAWGATTGVGTVYATGGNVVFWASSKGSGMWSNANSFLLPVRRGAGFSVGVMQVNGNDVAAPTSFVWVPFGSSASLRVLGEEEAAGYGLDALRPPEPSALPSPRVGGEVGELMDAVADVLGDRLTPPLRERLNSAVVALASRH